MSQPLPPFLKKHFLDQTLQALPLKKALAVEPAEPLQAVLHHFIEGRIGSLLVCEGGTLQGIVTERDLVMKLDPLMPDSRPIASLMTPNPFTLPPRASIARVLYTFSSGGFRHIPICSPGSRDLEVCSVRDVIDFIYRRLGKKVLRPNYEGESLAEQSEVQNFFESPVSLLEPSPVFSIPLESSSYEALAILKMNKIGSVAVVDSDKRLRGIVTERDFLTKLLGAGADARAVPVARIMTENPTTVLASGSVSLALSFLSEGRIRHLPVVDHEEMLVGMLSVKNFVRFLAARIVGELS